MAKHAAERKKITIFVTEIIIVKRYYKYRKAFYQY